MKKITSSEKIEEYFTPYQLDKILSEETIKSAKLLKIDTSEYLISQNDKINFIYFLVAGKLQVERYEINGEHVIFSFENAFSVIGDLELFQNNDSKKTVSIVQYRQLLSVIYWHFRYRLFRKKSLTPLFFYSLSVNILAKSFLMHHSYTLPLHSLLNIN